MNIKTVFLKLVAFVFQNHFNFEHMVQKKDTTEKVEKYKIIRIRTVKLKFYI